MSIGQRISELRKESGYSQEYVAEKLGVSRQAVSKWETDTSAPDTYNLIALSELFGVSVEYIAMGKRADAVQCESSSQVKENGITVQKILGIVLIGAGLISLILGFLLSEILILLAAYLILGGVLCITLRTNAGLKISWSTWTATFLIFSVLSHINLFFISFEGGISVGGIVTFIFWLWFALNLAFTVIKRLKLKRSKERTDTQN